MLSMAQSMLDARSVSALFSAEHPLHKLPVDLPQKAKCPVVPSETTKSQLRMAPSASSMCTSGTVPHSATPSVRILLARRRSPLAAAASASTSSKATAVSLCFHLLCKVSASFSRALTDSGAPSPFCK